MDDWVPMDAFDFDDLPWIVDTIMRTSPKQCVNDHLSCVDILVTMLELHLEYFSTTNLRDKMSLWWKLEAIWKDWCQSL